VKRELPRRGWRRASPEGSLVKSIVSAFANGWSRSSMTKEQTMSTVTACSHERGHEAGRLGSPTTSRKILPPAFRS